MITFALALVALLPSAAAQPLTPRGREVFDKCMNWADGRWDARAGFVRVTSPTRHNVRETGWYAVGLLMRDASGDRARAAQAIEAILEQQISSPGAPFDGTFFRAPQEPQPSLWPQIWTDYDPNWRAFIGTTFALMLNEYEARLPTALRDRMVQSIRRAVEGELKEGRLKPSYTNIAIMHGYLWAWAGQRLNRPQWVAAGEAWARSVYAGFNETGTFEEYNSPTYYGVDLYGLALWRKYGPTPSMRRMGADMEARLWRDIADYYHAGLRNLAGPYDRSYGMDMRRYVSLTGLWLRLVLDADSAPFPSLDGPLDHAIDYVYTPCFALLGAHIPPGARKHFERFQGERQITRKLTRGRVATAWLASNYMIGGEFTGKSRAAGTPRNNLIPATIHWNQGHIYLAKAPRLDARAEKDTLHVSAIGDCTFRITAPGLSASSAARDVWKLPGLTIRVETDATGWETVAGEGFLDVTYKDATRYRLRIEAP